MLFRCIPVPGTITPEHEPFEQVTDAQAPSASITDTCVVFPSRDRTSVATESSACLARKRSRKPSVASPSRNSSSRARFVESITSAITYGSCARSSRSRIPSASAIRIPPDEGGGFVSTSRPR